MNVAGRALRCSNGSARRQSCRAERRRPNGKTATRRVEGRRLEVYTHMHLGEMIAILVGPRACEKPFVFPRKVGTGG
jgi:hypothetical protein